MKDSQHEVVTDQLRKELRAHLDQCNACQAALQNLSADAGESGTQGPHCDLFAGHASNNASEDDSTVVESSPYRAPVPRAELPTASGATLVETPAEFVEFSREAVAHAFPDPPMDGRFVAAVGRYQVRELIAHGGMSTIYSALDTVSERPVVLKVMSTWLDAEDDARERISREAEAAKRVRHPNVIAVYDLLLRKDLPPTVVMEQLSGNTLRHALSDQVLLESRESASLLRGAARGLAACHDAGIVHRDVKPSNLLAEVVDGSMRLVVSDFGIARDATHDRTLTKAGGLLGTPAYMSPEQIRDPASVDARSDVYSLGCVLYEMLTGRPPFQGSVRMLLWQATHEIPRPPRSLNEKVDRALETICLKAIASNPAQRYETAAELADDLDRYLAGKPIYARPAGPITRLVKLCQRYPLRLTIAASVFVLLTGVTVVSLIAANRMADARRKETIALGEASRNAELAKEQSKLQEEAARVAEQQSELAFHTMTQVIEDVQSGLRSLPRGSPIRERLLKTSLANLQNAADGLIDQSAINMHSAKAMVELAQLYVRFGSPEEAGAERSGEGTASTEDDILHDSADRLFTRAYEIAWQTYQEQGESLEALQLARQIKTNHGYALMADSSDIDRTQETLQRSLVLARMAVEKSCNAPEDIARLVEQLANVSSVHQKLQEYETAAEYLSESLEIADLYSPLGEPSPSDPHFETYQQRLLQYTLLATLQRQAGKEEEALATFRLALGINRALITAWESVESKRLELAGIHVSSTYYLMQLDELDEALVMSDRAVEMLEDALEDDPDDQQTKGWLMVARDHADKVRKAKADGEVAQESLAK